MNTALNIHPNLLEDKKIIQANELLDRFVYSCSHDLKGPLVTIRGLLRLAEMTPDEASRSEYLGLISESVTRMDNFIKSLEDYMVNARGPVVRNDVDFKKLTDEVLAGKSSLIRKTGVTINTRVLQEGNFKSDDSRIKLILNNIIGNAIFFQELKKPEKFVDIQIEVTEEAAYIEICDNGEGICRENLNKIYRMFFRASTASQGSGMGLFLAKEAVKKIGGSIKVVSSKGVGSNFTIIIPNTSTVF